MMKTKIVLIAYMFGMIGTLIFGAIAGLFLFPVEPLWKYGLLGLVISSFIWSIAIIAGIRLGLWRPRSWLEIKTFLVNGDK